MRQQALDDLEIARRGLQRWLNVTQPVDISEGDILEASAPLISDSLMISSHPILRYYRQQIEVNVAQQKVEEAGLLPKLSFMYGSQSVDGLSGFSVFQAGVSDPLKIALDIPHT